MKHHPSDPPVLETLDAFAALMAETATLRREAATAVLAGRPVPLDVQADLARGHAILDEAMDRDGRAELDCGDDQSLRLDLSEETRQLENDVLYLEEGRDALLKHLARRHHGFRDALRQGLREVSGPAVGLLLCDCDAVLRAPGQRFVTAVQPAWNAVALSRYATARARRPILWSEAPLAGPGIADLATVPPRAFAYAASLGRQIVDATGKESASPLSLQKSSLLESINARLAMLLADPSWRAFAYVGSGLQFRRGETIVARQDVLGTIGQDASLDLLEHVHNIVDAVDPEREHFRVEDDGLDVAVTPTATHQEVSHEFSPAEGLRALDAALSLDLGQGPHLVCCGGPSGLALLEALAGLAADLRCVFVTDRADLGPRAREICKKTAVVSHPDLAAALLSAAAP
uniref:Uncharacterized protein n=1 Tax=Desulfovibrio sp. U5L TaxID=596152 RepID=I2Q499_9BACT